MTARAPSVIVVIVVVFAVALLGGCGEPYAISGRAVEGGFPYLGFVAADDPQLDGPGVAGVQIVLHRDAGRPNARVVAQGRSDGRGGLEIPVSEFGAGWMVEEWRIQATRSGFQDVDMVVTLPKAKDDRRLLIIMAPGYTPPGPEDPMEQFRRYR